MFSCIRSTFSVSDELWTVRLRPLLKFCNREIFIGQKFKRVFQYIDALSREGAAMISSTGPMKFADVMILSLPPNHGVSVWNAHQF